MTTTKEVDWEVDIKEIPQPKELPAEPVEKPLEVPAAIPK